MMPGDDDSTLSPLEIQDGMILDDVKQSENDGNVRSKDDGDIGVFSMMTNKSPKCWSLAGFYIAVFCIASLMSPAPHKLNSVSDAAQDIDNEDLLQLAENITKTCSASSIKNEKGRGECQEICLGHSCCFTNDEKSSYRCNDDPDMMCSVYVGCESLFLPAEDYLNDKQNNPKEDLDANEAPNLTTQQYNHLGTSELQLVSQVISTVCASKNLHTHQGLQECADLCNSSICCFDKIEIETLNPQFETILKLEGITDKMLHLSSIGSCVDESEFCLTQSGCKNLLLFGASRAGLSLQSNRQENEQRQTVIHVILFFGIVISLSAYLLIVRRLPSIQSHISTERDNLVETTHSDLQEIS